MSDFKMLIPYVNRPDLLAKAVLSAQDLASQLAIIDNSVNGLHGDTGWPAVIRPQYPLTCSQTFNFIMQLTREMGANICIWMHNDAEAGPGVCLELLNRAREYNAEGRKWGILWTYYDTLSAINTDLLDVVGEWDENLPQYFTDNDYYRRVKLAGWECIDTMLTDVKHVGSQTINSDPALKAENNRTFLMYRDYYIRKWGGEPDRETFLKPFNSEGILK